MSGLAWRGVVEGFYGEPWNAEDRQEFLRFAESVGLNRYVYAPKDDSYHRDRWREPYPPAQLQELVQLVEGATAHGVTFVYALAPALSMRFSSNAEHAALVAKAEQLWGAGVRSFALLFDDVPTELVHPDDLEQFGADAGGSGRAHGDACARFQRDFLAPHSVDEPLMMCPTDYAGTAASAYRDALAQTLPPDALVFWTGPDIVVGEVTRADIDAAAKSYDRDLLLWDNFPVNDFDRSRLFLGPLTGRSHDVAGSRLRGIAANPMVEAAPSRFALATVAEWAADPAGYEPDAAAARALTLVAGPAAAELAPLVAACSSWPPSAPQSPELDALIATALADGSDAPAAIDAVERLLSPLAAVTADAATATLREVLEPWLAAARDMAEAGLRACALLRALRAHGAADAVDARRDALREARRTAEAHYAAVLRATVTDFIAAVLALAGDETAPSASGRARVTIVTGANPAPGDRELAEHLTASGLTVTLAVSADEQAELVIVTRQASESAARAAATLGVPLLAWAHLVALGLAAESAVPLSLSAVQIADPAQPLAAGLDGRVEIYRGPGKVTWGTPSDDAVVVAHTPDEGRPAITFSEKGSRLADGSVASARRVTFFLGSDGFAPWLVTAEARALLDAAIAALLRRP